MIIDIVELPEQTLQRTFDASRARYPDYGTRRCELGGHRERESRGASVDIPNPRACARSVTLQAPRGTYPCPSLLQRGDAVRDGTRLGGRPTRRGIQIRASTSRQSVDSSDGRAGRGWEDHRVFCGPSPFTCHKARRLVARGAQAVGAEPRERARRGSIDAICSSPGEGAVSFSLSRPQHSASAGTRAVAIDGYRRTAQGRSPIRYSGCSVYVLRTAAHPPRWHNHGATHRIAHLICITAAGEECAGLPCCSLLGEREWARRAACNTWLRMNSRPPYVFYCLVATGTVRYLGGGTT